MEQSLWSQEKISAAKRHHMEFWNGTGMAMSLCVSHPSVKYQNRELLFEQMHGSAALMTDAELDRIAHTSFLCDAIPAMIPDYGSVALAQILGSGAVYRDHSVWYQPCLENLLSGMDWGYENKKHWLFLKEIFQRMQNQKPRGASVSCPAYTAGLDTLAALRGSEELLLDMLDYPEQVHACLREINRVYAVILEETMDVIMDEDGGSCFEYFRIWGQGKTSQLQCDLAATISPAMYDEFVIPYLREQCRMLDRSIYHVDGTQALRHMKSLLSVPELTAVEWTPQDGIETGGNQRWYPLYHQILDAGKGVQIVGVKKEEIRPLIEELGNQGIFIIAYPQSQNEAEEMTEIFNELR